MALTPSLPHVHALIRLHSPLLYPQHTTARMFSPFYSSSFLQEKYEEERIAEIKSGKTSLANTIDDDDGVSDEDDIEEVPLV